MRTRSLARVHGGQKVRRGGRVGLGSRHLAHEVRRVDGLGLLRLRVEQLRVQGAAQELRLIEVVVREEGVEVGVGVGGDVKGIR